MCWTIKGLDRTDGSEKKFSQACVKASCVFEDHCCEDLTNKG